MDITQEDINKVIYTKWDIEESITRIIKQYEDLQIDRKRINKKIDAMKLLLHYNEE